MTNWLWLFLAFYILVGQPALLWRMLDNCSLYQLAWLNAGIFFIAWIISAIAKSGNNKTPTENNDNTVKVAKKSEEKVSRIENDEGVAIVEVQKKEEIVVETKAEEQDEDIEGLPQDSEEKLEDKKEEEEKPARPMRENVSIPKIVQPLSWHAPIQKRKKEVKRWQRIVLLITLVLAVVIAWTLWEFLGNRWVAIALLLWWVLYLVIGKLFDIAGFYNAKKLFTNWLYIILILAWIGYGVYATQNNNSINLIKDKAVSYIQNLFKSEEIDNSEVNEWEDVIYVFEGTGEVITGTGDNIDILDEKWITENEIENTEIDTWVVEDTQPEVEVQPEVVVDNSAPAISPEEAKKQVTMWEAIKSLLAGSTLSTKTNTTFKYVSKSNELYPYFKTAQEKWMIGTDTDPSKIISCETYITMKWIREWRDVGNYSKSEIKSAYWNKATELWKLNGCTKWAYVTRGNL